MYPTIVRKFKAINLLAAIGLALLGVALLCQPLYSNVIYIKAMLGGFFAVLGGGWVLIANVWNPACSNCRKFLQEYEASFLTDTDRQYLEAGLNGRNPELLLQVLHGAPIAPMPQSGDTRFVLFIESCDSCRQIARMRLCQASFGANNERKEGKTLVNWVEIQSPHVATIMQRVIERNQNPQAYAFAAVAPRY